MDTNIRRRPVKEIRYRNLNMFSSVYGNCYVIRCIDGDVLIDTGDIRCRDEIEVWLLNYDIKLIVLTHGHNDHIGNAAYFADMYDVPIAMSRCDIPLIKNNKCRKMYTMNGTGLILTPFRNNCQKLTAEHFRPDLLLDDGMKLSDLNVDGVLMSSKIISLDGHTRGSIGILDGRDLYCGDALFGSPFSLEPEYAESPKASVRTMKRIAAISPLRIFMGHGEPIIRGDKLYRKFLEKYT